MVIGDFAMLEERIELGHGCFTGSLQIANQQDKTVWSRFGVMRAGVDLISACHNFGQKVKKYISADLEWYQQQVIWKALDDSTEGRSSLKWAL